MPYISTAEAGSFTATFGKVEKDPYKRAKKMVVTSKTEIWHLSDYESNERFHVQQFHHTIDHLKKASRIKNITYKFGYSNFTFDLWMILHKMDCNKMMIFGRIHFRIITSCEIQRLGA